MNRQQFVLLVVATHCMGQSLLYLERGDIESTKSFAYYAKELLHHLVKEFEDS